MVNIYNEQTCTLSICITFPDCDRACIWIFNSLTPGDLNEILYEQSSSDWWLKLPSDMDFTGDKLTLVMVMAWCRRTTSHYLSQCWPRSMLAYGITWPQCLHDWWRACLYGCCETRKFARELNSYLTLKHRETHGCVVSTVATDALVLKHQAISIHNAD